MSSRRRILRIRERSQMKHAMSVALALTAAGLSGCPTVGVEVYEPLAKGRRLFSQRDDNIPAVGLTLLD